MLSGLGLLVTEFISFLFSIFIDEKVVKSFFQRTVTYRTGLPIVTTLLLLLLTLSIRIYQLKRMKTTPVNCNEMEKLQANIQEIVRSQEYVDSIQVYRYSIKSDKKSRFIRLEYVTGVADERVEINSILQSYYYFPHPLFKKIRKFNKVYEAYKNETDPTTSSNYRTQYQELGEKICSDILDTLNSISSPNDIREYHCEMYRALSSILPAISGKAYEWFLMNQEVERSIIRRKKTGVIGAIILGDIHIFKNRVSQIKNNRIYSAHTMKLGKEVLIILTSYNENSICNDIIDIEKYCSQVKKSIAT